MGENPLVLAAAPHIRCHNRDILAKRTTTFQVPHRKCILFLLLLFHGPTQHTGLRDIKAGAHTEFCLVAFLLINQES